MSLSLKMAIVVLVMLFVGGIGTCSSYNFVDSFELGYQYDKFTGQTSVLPRTGAFFINPFAKQIHVIDLRPQQICLNANTRVLACKLVRFEPGCNDDKTSCPGLDLFLSWHGRADYTYGGSPGTVYLGQLLMPYAFDPDNKPYPFLVEVKRTN